MEENKVASVDPESIVTVQVSGDFYYRLQTLFVYLIKDITEERIADVLQMIKDNGTKEDPEAFNIETMVSLLCSIEQRFKEENLIVLKDIPTQQSKDSE